MNLFKLDLADTTNSAQRSLLRWPRSRFVAATSGGRSCVTIACTIECAVSK